MNSDSDEQTDEETGNKSKTLEMKLITKLTMIHDSDDGQESDDDGQESDDDGQESDDDGQESDDDGQESDDDGQESDDGGEYPIFSLFWQLLCQISTKILKLKFTLRHTIYKMSISWETWR
jgi:hypothetical protein